MSTAIKQPCYLVEPKQLGEPGEDWWQYPGGVRELVNDGIDGCEKCEKLALRTGGGMAYSHGHAPDRWTPTEDGGTAYYHCDACGHRWTCWWAARDEDDKGGLGQ